MMIEEHDRVVLMRDFPDKKLKEGDVGAVIAIHKMGEGYTVEFVSLAGETMAIQTLLATDVREVETTDLAHVRKSA